MSNIICWKCHRSVEPLERTERDTKTKKRWFITYCPFERCNANLDIKEGPQIKVWNGNYFVDESNDEVK